MSTQLLILIGITSVSHSKTTNCNYVVDTWWLTADPPTSSPTSAPTDNPTMSPTNSPTWINETRTTMWDDDHGGSNLKSDSSERAFSTIRLLNPYPINSCYSINLTDPIDQVSIKYSCDSSTNTLTRNIYWDSLECDGDDVDTKTFTEQKAFTAYVCNAATNCASATIDIYQAKTMSPTPEPTESPTFSPTNSPTLVDEINATFIMDDSGGGASGNNAESDDGFNCDNTLGPNGDEAILSWTYAAQNICLNKDDLIGLFNDSDSSDGDGIQSFGWNCEDDTYTFKVYTVADCVGNATEYLAYNDDACALGDGAWSYVTCGTSAEPTPSPTPCVEGGCGTDEICKTVTGECTPKTQDVGCSEDNECSDQYGDDYKCNEDKGFCYFDQCEDDDDCTDYEQATITYSCSEKDGESNGIDYIYGICSIDPTGSDQSGSFSYNVFVSVLVTVILGVVFERQTM